MTSKVPRSFCFTISNWAEFPPVIPPHCDYLVCQQELAPSTGTPHIQGYCHLDTAVSMKKLKSLSTDWHKAHIESARGTPSENTTYCTKAESRVPSTEPYIYGTEPSQGKRTDMQEILSMIESGSTLDQVAHAYPGQWVRYMAGIQDLYQRFSPPLVFDLPELRPWQQRLIDIISEPPCPRRIFFVIDPDGGAGKSTFARFLASKHSALVVKPAKYDRINLQYTGQPIVVFDYPRSTTGPDHALPYPLIEQFKDGCRAAGMYGKPGAFYPIPHVFVFTNAEPDVTALSRDRLDGSLLRVSTNTHTLPW